MKAASVVVGAALAGAALAGCGGSGQRTPSLAGLPLPPHAHVTVDVQACNEGSNAYCARQLVVSGPAYPTSQAMLDAEKRLLHRLKWSSANAPVGLERAADSPGDRLRVTYATASSDLQGVDLGWIDRGRRVTLALSHALFSHTSTLSFLLELGTT
jgi:hypothetical protein